MTREPHRFSLGWTLGLIAIAGGTAVAFFPTPARLLSDHGHGYQLAGAAEILAGRQPFIAFKDIYGPLTHYASAAGQWLSGGRVLGELVLNGAGIAAGCALLFRLMLRGGVRPGLAAAFTVVAIAVQPVSWRYYLLLTPLLVLSAAWHYTERPGTRRLTVVALTVVIAGLFRPDLGVFTGISAAVIVAMTPEAERSAGSRLAMLAGLVALGAAPWCGWLVWHGKLWPYLENSSLDALRDAAGRARPAPGFEFGADSFGAANAKAYLLRLPWGMMIFAAVTLGARWRNWPADTRARLAGALVLAALTQLQAAHIVDWLHVRDTLPIRILLLAIVAEAGAAGVSRAWRWAEVAVIFMVAASLLVAASSTVVWREFAPRRMAAKLADYARPRAELLAEIRQRGTNFRAELYEYVREHSAPDETILAVIEAPQTNYFAERGLAGPQLSIFPGYFASERDQRELIAQLRSGRTAFVIIDHLGQLEYPGMTLDRFAPELWRFLQEEFVEVKRIGYCAVLAPRWRRSR